MRFPKRKNSSPKDQMSTEDLLRLMQHANDSIEIDPTQPTSAVDIARYDQLKDTPLIVQSEAALIAWSNTDAGWDRFQELIFGAPIIVAKDQSSLLVGNFMERHPDFFADQESVQKVLEGFLHIFAQGWAIAMVEQVNDAWTPDGDSLDAKELADKAALAFGSSEQPGFSDVEWFGYEARKGLTVFQSLLLPLGISSLDAWRSLPTAELMRLGRWMLCYGIVVGKTQIELQKT